MPLTRLLEACAPQGALHHEPLRAHYRSALEGRGIMALMALMATLTERILLAIHSGPLDDDVLSSRLGVEHRQVVNQAARRLEAQGHLRRFIGPDGKVVSALPDTAARELPVSNPQNVAPGGLVNSRITEDEVKEAVRRYLTEQGFDVVVAWGRARGVDLDARHPDGRRYVIEAKAETGKNGAQQVSYFLGMLGELVQRMEYPHATYEIALPVNRQYRGLVERLPALAKQRLGLAVFWVRRHGDEGIVDVVSDACRRQAV